jgi:hypothetical protein
LRVYEPTRYGRGRNHKLDVLTSEVIYGPQAGRIRPRDDKDEPVRREGDGLVDEAASIQVLRVLRAG